MSTINDLDQAQDTFVWVKQDFWESNPNYW